MSKDYHVLSIRDITQDCFLLKTDRGDLKFDAGQLVSLGIRGSGVNREYSIYSAENEPYLEFLVRKVRNGTVSVGLSQLKEGDKVFILGPYSDFKIKNTIKPMRPHWLVATGTGIAPFRSMVASYPMLDYKIIHGIREIAERYDHTLYKKGSYLACVTHKAESNIDEGIFPGRVTDYLRSIELSKKVIYYLCGNNNMITEAYEILRNRGVSSDDIQSEVFF